MEHAYGSSHTEQHHPLEGSDPGVGSVNGLDPSRECLDSRSMSNTIEPSSFSKGQGRYSSDEKYNTKTTQRVTGKYIVAVALEFLTSSSSRMVEECSVSNVNNSNEANRSDQSLLSTIDNKEKWKSNPSYQNISRCEVRCTKEIGNSRKGNEISNPKPTLKGNQHGRTPQNDTIFFENVMPKKRRRQILPCYEDVEALQVDYSKPRSSQNDTAQFASQTVVDEEHCSPSMRLAISARTNHQWYSCTRPIDKPCWIGIMRVGQDCISFSAYLSNYACKMVRELSLSLPPIIKVTVLPKLKAWPKRWEASDPTAESIGLYFLPHNMRENKDLDRLVHHVIDHSIVLKYAFGSTKLLIFPSVLLPEKSQMFQGKHYLWGVFKRRKIKRKTGALVEKKVYAGCRVAEKQIELQDKVEGYASQVVQEEIEHQDKVHGDTPDEEVSVSEHIMPSETEHIDHGKAHSNAETPTASLFGLINLQTPRSVQLMQELENEGALVFAINGLGKLGPHEA